MSSTPSRSAMVREILRIQVEARAEGRYFFRSSMTARREIHARGWLGYSRADRWAFKSGDIHNTILRLNFNIFNS